MWIIIDEKYENLMIKEVFKQKLHFSNRLISSLKLNDGIYVNNEKARIRYILKIGDVLEIKFSSKFSENVEPQDIPLDILYEDDYVMVINKPPHMPSHPSPGHDKDTLVNAVAGYYRSKKFAASVRMLGRLDANTSGMVIISKNQFVHNELTKDLSIRKNNKIYYAIIEGVMNPPSGIIDLPIGLCEDSIIKRRVCEDGKSAITHYKTLKVKGNYSLVEIELKTGRTHQIRVHFSHMRHPLVGDFLYGSEIGDIDRHALHAYSVKFLHPITKEVISISSNMPEDMQNLLNK